MGINLEELIADRDAGSKGKFFYVADGECSHITSEFCVTEGVESISDDLGFSKSHPLYITAYMGSNQDNADINRIARLPELEAAYIDAVELIKLAAEGCALHVDLIDFLEKHT